MQISRGIYAHWDFQRKRQCKLHIKLQIDLMGTIDSYEEWAVRHFYFGGWGGTISSHPLFLALLLSLLFYSNNNKDVTVLVGNQRWSIYLRISESIFLHYFFFSFLFFLKRGPKHINLYKILYVLNQIFIIFLYHFKKSYFMCI